MRTKHALAAAFIAATAAVAAGPGFAEATRKAQEVIISNSSENPVVARIEGTPAVSIDQGQPIPVEVKQIAEQPPLMPLQGEIVLEAEDEAFMASAEPLVVPSNEEWTIERVGHQSLHHSDHIEILSVRVQTVHDAQSKVHVPIETPDASPSSDPQVQSIDHMTKLVAPPGSRVYFSLFRAQRSPAGSVHKVVYTGSRRRIAAGEYQR